MLVVMPRPRVVMRRNNTACDFPGQWWMNLSEEDQVAIVQTISESARRKAVRPLLRVLAGSAGLTVRITVALVLDNLADSRCIPLFKQIALDNNADLGLRCICTEALRWFVRRGVVRTTLFTLAQDRRVAIRGSVVCALYAGVQTKKGVLELIEPTLRLLADDSALLSSGVPVAKLAAELLALRR